MCAAARSPTRRPTLQWVHGLSRNVFDLPGTLQRDGVQELEGGVDLPISRVGQAFDFDLMEEELPVPGTMMTTFLLGALGRELLG
jgi:hypothetical protein